MHANRQRPASSSAQILPADRVLAGRRAFSTPGLVSPGRPCGRGSCEAASSRRRGRVDLPARSGNWARPPVLPPGGSPRAILSRARQDQETGAKRVSAAAGSSGAESAGSHKRAGARRGEDADCPDSANGCARAPGANDGARRLRSAVQAPEKAVNRRSWPGRRFRRARGRESRALACRRRAPPGNRSDPGLTGAVARRGGYVGAGRRPARRPASG